MPLVGYGILMFALILVILGAAEMASWRRRRREFQAFDVERKAGRDASGSSL